MRGNDKFHHLHAQTLARELVEAITAGNARGKAGCVGVVTGAVGCVETEKAQDAQIVLGDAFGRIADKTHAAVAEIVEPTGIIVDRAIARCRQRIDGEIAPFGVGLPVAPEFDLGMAAVGLDVLAQRRHLERMLVDNDRDGAVLDTGRDRLEPGGRNALHNFFRHRGGSDVNLGDRHAQQRVSHRAADDARLFAIAIEHSEQARQRATCEPAGVVQFPIGTARLRLHHFVVPGTNLPSSICAGT